MVLIRRAWKTKALAALPGVKPKPNPRKPKQNPSRASGSGSVLINIWYNIFHTFRYRPPYKPQHDIALVRVKDDPIKFSNLIRPICLPSKNFPDLKGVVYVAGTNSNHISQVYFQKSPNLQDGERPMMQIALQMMMVQIRTLCASFHFLPVTYLLLTAYQLRAHQETTRLVKD